MLKVNTQRPWQNNTILLAVQTGALASSFSNLAVSWTFLVAVGGKARLFTKGAAAPWPH